MQISILVRSLCEKVNKKSVKKGQDTSESAKKVWQNFTDFVPHLIKALGSSLTPKTERSSLFELQ